MLYNENKLLIENFFILCVYYFIDSKPNELLSYEMCLRSIMNALFVISPTRPLFSENLFIDGENPRKQVIYILSKNQNLDLINKVKVKQPRLFNIMKQAYVRDISFDNKFTSSEIAFFKNIVLN